MKVEDLMKPRYEVIADYPECEKHLAGFKVGRIVSEPNINWLSNHFGIEVTKYPHLFRKREWWEDRKPEEMPEYVKRGNNVFKFKWLVMNADYPRKRIASFYVDGIYSILTSNGTLPATREEYDAAQKYQTKKPSSNEG